MEARNKKEQKNTMDKQLHQLTLAIASSFVVTLLFLVDLGVFSQNKGKVAKLPQQIIFLENIE